MARGKKKEETTVAEQHELNLGMRFALIYFAILVGMTFVFLAVPPAHS
jgi:hypothetical protein